MPGRAKGDDVAPGASPNVGADDTELRSGRINEVLRRAHLYSIFVQALLPRRIIDKAFIKRLNTLCAPGGFSFGDT